jgi:long-chain acyl-CoA synthetase
VSARTVYQDLEETARIHGDAPALRQALHQAVNQRSAGGNGSVETYSWNQYKQAVEEIAAGLRGLGLGKGDEVALNSETRLEFYLADLGIMTNGSIAAAMYPSYPPKDLVRTIAATGARAVFVEDPKTLTTLRDGAAP